MTIRKITDNLLGFASWNAGAFLGSQTTLRVACYRQPHPMPHQMVRALDHPLRMSYRDPLRTLGEFGIAAGTTVLDLGCGSGTFTLEMARLVGAEGTVHAVDIQQPLVETAQARITAAALAAQVRFHCSGAYDLPLADNSVDMAVLVATLGEIPDKARALQEVQRILKPNGTLAISEELPDPAYVPPFLMSRWVEDAGFRYGGRSGTPFCYNLVYFAGG